jgi:hypothetical protein
MRIILPRAAALAAAVVVAAFSAAEPMNAQELEPALTVDELRYCLCLEQELEDERAELDLRHGILTERENELERLGMEIQMTRASMNPEDVQAGENLKALIGRQETLRQLLRRDIVQSYQDSVRSYNEALTSYNSTCANRRIYTPDVEKAKQNLQCGKQP